MDDGEMTTGKFRWRTRLRAALPWRPPLYLLVPKGRDCGNHEWYNADRRVEHCYHCKAERTARPEWRATSSAVDEERE
jgi:hypothetical protein